MKKSAKVTVAFLSSFAAAVMNGCDEGGDWVEAKRCVNDNNVVVEDRWCDDQITRDSGHGPASTITTTAGAVTIPAMSSPAEVGFPSME